MVDLGGERTAVGRGTGVPRDKARARARDLLAIVDFSDFENKFPMELSGDMQQRAAISRALVHDPSNLLMGASHECPNVTRR